MKTQRLLIVAALLGWCAILIFAGAAHTGTRWFGFLLWNLLLAVIPLLAASAFDVSKPRPLAALWFFLWILFLPNAPYICTDLIHLGHGSQAPLWYDLIVLLSCAGTGLFLCYLSLLDVQQKIEARWGGALGWFVACGALWSCACGIYAGRFLRWNSWDVFTRPRALAAQLIALAARGGASNPLGEPNPFLVVPAFAIALLLGYAALRVLAVPRDATPRD